MLIPDGTRVRILHSSYTGVVCGYAGYHDDERTFLAYLVKLDKGFFSPDGELYISVIVAHADSLVVLEDVKAEV